MRNRGIRNPAANALVALALLVCGTAGIIYGTLTMNALGEETAATGVAIGLGVPMAVIGLFMTPNFLLAVRLVRGMQRGDRVIARWTVTPEAFDAFRRADAARSKQNADNDYRLPRRIPATGIEVIFSNDAVVIGNTFFGLSSTGIASFTGARLLTGTPMLEFDMRMLSGRSEPTVRFHDVLGVLRVPVAHTATDDAHRVVKHYIDVIERRTIVNPGFWLARMRLGLVIAAVFALIGASGFLLNDLGLATGVVPLAMAVVGVIVSIGGVVLWLIAYRMNVAQKGRAA